MSNIRIGIVGAGANTELRHIPGFREIDGVEIVGVVNRSAESTQRSAATHEIPKTYESWEQLVSDPDIDAVMIGTWPNMHEPITCAALNNGKHVLCEARMARNLAEARSMHETSQQRPDLITQIVPSPFGFTEQPTMLELIADGYLGQLREVVVIGANNLFTDASKPLHWRQDKSISGLNILAMGILHEAVSRYVPATTRVFAQSGLFGATQTSDAGEVAATVPDSVQIVTELEGGARGLYHLSGAIHHGPGLQLHLYGSDGTIKLEVTPESQLLIGKASDESLTRVEIPEEKRGGWRVEAEFIGAIRGEEKVQLTSFEKGLAYMEFTEAVDLSSRSGAAVDLPLKSFV